MPERVIYLVRSWPRLSQTFIVNEILALERRGWELAVFSLVHSEEEVVQPQVTDVRAEVTYLDGRGGAASAAGLRAHLRCFVAAPQRYAAALATSLRRPGLAAGYGDGTTLRCFHHAVQVSDAVHRMRARGVSVTHLHAHFAHDPALVGMLASRLTGLRFSFTGHARDLLQIPASSLAARAASATAVVTCCQVNADYIAGAVPASARPSLEVIHHGVDLRRFRPTARRSTGTAPLVVSVGRLVQKKGYDDLLEALAALRRAGVRFDCHIYGDGPLGAQLERQRDSLGLGDRVRFLGARSNDEVLASLAAADAFVLTPRQTDDGDRDGIPNVLVEAMACGLPVVAAAAGGIAELVRDQDNGLLVPVRDVRAVTAALRRLLEDPELRRRLGDAGRRTVEADYDVEVAARRLETVFRQSSSAPVEVSR